MSERQTVTVTFTLDVDADAAAALPGFKGSYDPADPSSVDPPEPGIEMRVRWVVSNVMDLIREGLGDELDPVLLQGPEATAHRRYTPEPF